MGRKVYNKLVRSEIPTIIKESGRECIYAKLKLDDNREEIIKLLKEKLVEEANEVVEAIHRGDILEEMGDLIDVYNELKYILEGPHGRDITTIRDAKAIQKGTFCFKIDSNGNRQSLQGSGDLTYYKLIAVDDGKKD